MELTLSPIEELQEIMGISFPKYIKYRQLLVSGPPGAGKSTMIRKIGGWPEEGYIDLTFENWWKAQALSLRPREVNFGFPFKGMDEALVVFEQAWLEADSALELDESRIILPPKKTNFLMPNWRARFVFEFLPPPPDAIMAARLDRSGEGFHPIDQGVTEDQVKRQVDVYRQAAIHFKRPEC